MKPHLTAFLSGVVFAAGLVLGGMTQPQKVLGFLDPAGDWDPSLALVMLGAIGTGVVLFRLILRRTGPVFGDGFQLPRRKDIDPRLVVGAALFGVGWGLGGYCPGPGLVSLASGGLSALVFAVAMAGGMVVNHIVDGALRDVAKERSGAGAEPA